MDQRRLALAVRAFLCLALASTLLCHLPTPTPRQLASQSVTLSTTLLERESSPSGERLTLEDSAHQRYTAFIPTTAFNPGDQLLIRAVCEPFEPARNPGAFSPQQLAAQRGLSGNLVKLHVLASRPGNPADWRFWPARFRLWAQSSISSRFPSDEAALLTGMLWGDHHALSIEDSTAFSRTGTSHLLVTAGLHLGFFAAIVRLVLRLLTIERGWAAAATMLLTWCACVISNTHIPSVRAATMISVFLCAEMLGTTGQSLRTLGYALVITLSCNPSAVGEISLYLSFSCVFALIAGTQLLEQALRPLRLHHWLAKTLAVTTAAQIGTWALIALQFHQISLSAPLANCLAIPLALLCLALAPGLLIGIALHCSVISAVMQPLLHLALGILLALVRWCAHLPLSALHIHTPALWSVIGYEIALVLCGWLIQPRISTSLVGLVREIYPHLDQRRQDWLLTYAFSVVLRQRLAISTLLGAGVMVVLTSSTRTPELRITMLDVGQGDGIVVQTPHGHTIIIDTGGRLELHAQHLAQSPAEIAAAGVFLPFLQSEAISQIDLLLLTHPHGDHAGGVAPLIRTLPVTLFLDSGQAYAGTAYQDGIHQASLTQVTRIFPRRGAELSFDDGVTLRILAPQLRLFHGGRNDINENSIVTMLCYQHFRMLFTGDAGFQAESQLLAQRTDLRADVLKVGHHGSAYASSTEFLEAVHPRIALISVGRHNLFHHPAAPTLARLRAIGARIYRTDQCGAITVTPSSITTMLPCT